MWSIHAREIRPSEPLASPFLGTTLLCLTVTGGGGLLGIALPQYCTIRVSSFMLPSCLRRTFASSKPSLMSDITFTLTGYGGQCGEAPLTHA